MKELKELTYQELVQKCIEKAVEGFLESGLKGLKSSVEQVVDISLRWRRDTSEENLGA